MGINFRRLRFVFVKTTLITLFFCLLFLRGYRELEETGENYFHIFVNGTEVGTLADASGAENMLLTAKKNVAARREGFSFITAELSVTGEEVLIGKVDSGEQIVAAMETVLENYVEEPEEDAYTLKVNEYAVNLASERDVRTLLQAALNKYGSMYQFSVELVHDDKREFNVLTAKVYDRGVQDVSAGVDAMCAAGIQTVLCSMGEDAEEMIDKEFADYDLGLISMNFAEEVEIVKCNIPASQLTDVEVAMDYLVADQEVPQEYTVVSGDTLSEISIKVNIPIDRLVELNTDKLKDENSTIRVGDKLIITVPEPELSVERVEQNYYEEVYDADVIYVDNDSWYTTKTKVLQQPSAGFRKVVAKVFYMNDEEVSREIVKEEVLMEAVPKIVERGTKIPPTYIKPISGGRVSSPFGKRERPTKGASTYHKGIDWAVSTGTAVCASSGGTVAKAGWGSGYGYVVYINHADGRQTRYAHLSKVLVKAGQTVKQGERIALSGNTGVSSGPHLHFEILIDGKQVNPTKYLD